MKYRLTLLASLIFSVSTLSAQYTPNDLNPEQETNLAQSNTTPKPCQLEASFDMIGRSKFNRHDGHGHIRYSRGNIETSCGFYYNPCYKEGLAATVGYTYTLMDWKHNPFFHQKHFHTATVGLSAFSHRLCDWLWRSQVAINMDTDHFNFHYTTYDLLLWGKYEYCEDIGLHVGLLAFTGLRIDRVYPIIGFDWKYSCHWKFNLVFPIDISAVYTINDCWSVSLTGRPFYSRNRAAKHSRLSNAVFEYENAGAEFAVNYQLSDWLHANVHVGEAFGGKLKVANQHDHHPHHFRFNSAGYIGGEVDISF